MIDALLLLTPLFLLGVVALLGFVGCNQVFGLVPTGLEAEITGLNPASGPSVGGTKVQVFGSNLTGVDGATFGGVSVAGFSPVSDSEIDVVTPPNPPARPVWY